MPLLRPKIVLDTQILSYVHQGTICPADWNAVLRYISRTCRYAISANTLYELLAGMAKGDENHFREHQNRIRLLCQPAGREFLPTVGDFVRSKVFRLPPRKPAFQPHKLCLWADVALDADSTASLRSGVVLSKAGRSKQTYGFDLQLLVKQIEDGKKSHAQRLDKLRQGKVSASTDHTWAKANLNLIDVPVTENNTSKLLAALDAARQYDLSLYELANNHSYDFSNHDSDWIDSQQLYYLADPLVRIVTCDAHIKPRILNSAQRDRLLTFEELKKLAVGPTA